MTHSIVWNESAINTAAGFLAEDPVGLRELLSSIDCLADDPQPADSLEYGSPGLRRLHAGRYRVLYEITDVITVIHIGRLR